MKMDTTKKKIELWLWPTGNDTFVAYDSPCPCDENGDPKVVGEPLATALYAPCSPVGRHDN